MFSDGDSKRVSRRREKMGRHTRQGDSACDLLGRSNWGVVVRHAGGGGVSGGVWRGVVVDMRMVAIGLSEVVGIDTSLRGADGQ